MEQNNHNVNHVKLDTSAKEFYNINNDKCPICQQGFDGLSAVYTHYRVGVHLSCHVEAAGIDKF